MIAYTMIAVGEAGWLVFVSAVLQFNSVITVTIRWRLDIFDVCSWCSWRNTFSTGDIFSRAQCTKSVELEEYGRIFSAVGFFQVREHYYRRTSQHSSIWFQALVPLIANPLFSLVYRFTVEIYPGTYLLVLVGLLSIGKGILGSRRLYLLNLQQFLTTTSKS